MKNLFLIWLLLYAFTGSSAFAEKAMSPVLLTPADFSKSISNDNVTFSWQTAQNEIAAKVIAYRIVISEDYRFNGYSQSTGKCNITCVVGVVNKPSWKMVSGHVRALLKQASLFLVLLVQAHHQIQSHKAAH
jgi:hypothetical protein